MFLDNVATCTLAFEGGGRVVEYVGGYEDYVRQTSVRAGRGRAEGRARPGAGKGKSTSTGPVPSVASSPSVTRRKRTFKEAREFEALPARIAALEREQQELQVAVSSPEFYQAGAGRIAAVLDRIPLVHDELERALARWLELEEVSQ